MGALAHPTRNHTAQCRGTTRSALERHRAARNVSFVEGRELARILGTNLARLELAVEVLESAQDHATVGKSRGRAKPL